jgi:hypothetical protein
MPGNHEFWIQPFHHFGGSQNIGNGDEGTQNVELVYDDA